MTLLDNTVKAKYHYVTVLDHVLMAGLVKMINVNVYQIFLVNFVKVRKQGFK
jgi:hypothetical protein